ncbi:MAG: hypothetical protein COV07_01365 [Candidatus Vogelbacteria bacterium CG10_big_fil_rev_8_21_14_0_10_45_14]|uniref:Helicase ATP-binding domain-containing protein n=1 Tax=Candidatus Vogelbacteria bacterium CG10_big_fil_rev_8_21_14_0_10_45_14 TaxID=1975042 RepID=A0A2H0RKJ7_9BACT|nr:MAG: hypothetical protein COV07_01365 [Candidatus Vogelbacteria bacterium CG10_big_fil_rev_8_21_14_0_10_45_14]
MKEYVVQTKAKRKEAIHLEEQISDVTKLIVKDNERDKLPAEHLAPFSDIVRLLGAEPEAVAEENDRIDPNTLPGLEEIRRLYPMRYKLYRLYLRKAFGHKFTAEEEKHSLQLRTALKALNNLDEYLEENQSNPQERVLRERQFETFRKIKLEIENGLRTGYIQMPTGAGKTVIFIELLKAMGLRTLIVVPRRLLSDQTKEGLEEFGGELDVGEVNSFRKKSGSDVTITTYNSLMINLNKIDSNGENGEQNGVVDVDPSKYDLIIFDEAHRALSDKRQEAIRKHFKKQVVLGFTATPNFSDSKQVGALFGEAIDECTLAEGVKAGIVARPIHMRYITSACDIGDVKSRYRDGVEDYDRGEMDRKLSRPEHCREIADVYFNDFDGQATIANCAGIDHATILADEINAEATRLGKEKPVAAVISSRQTKAQQTSIKDAFERGEIDVLCNAEMLVEGFDSLRATICFNVVPTKSYVRAEQRAGRVLRIDKKNSSKLPIVVDFIYAGEKSTVLFSHIYKGEKPDVDIKDYFDKRRDSGGVVCRDPRRVRESKGMRLVTRIEEINTLDDEMEMKEAPLAEDGYHTYRELVLHPDIIGGRRMNSALWKSLQVEFERNFGGMKPLEIRRHHGKPPTSFATPLFLHFVTEELQILSVPYIKWIVDSDVRARYEEKLQPVKAHYREGLLPMAMEKLKNDNPDMNDYFGSFDPTGMGKFRRNYYSPEFVSKLDEYMDIAIKNSLAPKTIITFSKEELPEDDGK